MTLSAIAVAGDSVAVEDAHGPPAGGGVYILASTLQSLVYINGNLIIVDGQTFSFHIETGTCNASSTLLYINGKAVVRHGDTATTPSHSNSGVSATTQSVVYSE